MSIYLFIFRNQFNALETLLNWLSNRYGHLKIICNYSVIRYLYTKSGNLLLLYFLYEYETNQLSRGKSRIPFRTDSNHIFIGSVKFALIRAPMWNSRPNLFFWVAGKFDSENAINMIRFHDFPSPSGHCKNKKRISPVNYVQTFSFI